MPRTSRASRLAWSLRVVLAVVRVAARAVGLYSSLRLRLWLWRRLSAWRFSRALRGVPEGLRGELAGMYRDLTGQLRLPGLAEAARGVYGLRGRYRRRGRRVRRRG